MGFRTLLHNNVVRGTVIEPQRVVYCESVTELSVIGQIPNKRISTAEMQALPSAL